jgi:hypothetical protein
MLWLPRNPFKSQDRESRQKVHRVGQFERLLRVAAAKVALLIAHIHDDGVALLGELPPLRRLEISSALERLALGQQDDARGPIAFLAQVAFGGVTQLGRSASNEEDGHGPWIVSATASRPPARVPVLATSAVAVAIENAGPTPQISLPGDEGVKNNCC